LQHQQKVLRLCGRNALVESAVRNGTVIKLRRQKVVLMAIMTASIYLSRLKKFLVGLQMKHPANIFSSPQKERTAK